MTERDPPPHDWVQITDELLASREDEWVNLVERFEPVRDGEEMADWLRTSVHDRKMQLEAWACVGDDELLGFYAVTRAEMEFSHRALPILSIRRLGPGLRRPRGGPQPGLLLSSITRSRSTEAGFGRVLLLHAVGLALEDPDNMALFVKPASADVSRMWRENYGFKTMDKPAPDVPDVLWLPINPSPGSTWP
jgi:hypothetical protein